MSERGRPESASGTATSQSRRDPNRPTWGIELTPDRTVGTVGALAESAEAVGFNTVVTSCHYNNRDPLVTLSRLATRTDTVRIGPGVANPYDIHPIRLVAAIATLDELSDGRAIMGIGAGDESTLSNLGIERTRPLRRVLETVQIARRLWAGDRIDHAGTFSANDAGLNFTPADAIPVYVGGQGPDMLRMAGKHADGVLVNGAHPRDLQWARQRIDEGVAERTPNDSVETVAFTCVSIAEQADRARQAARRPVAFIAAGAPPPVLQRHAIDQTRCERIGDAIAAGAFERADELVSDAMIAAFSATGDPSTVRNRLVELLEYADGLIVAAPLGPDPHRAIELAGAALDPADR